MNRARMFLARIINADWDVTITNADGGTIITVRTGTDTAQLTIGSRQKND
ncbi:hypothetical protein [Arthrobacter sp. HY1533]|nr:hypothetical protein [Arthrobacter sp. HY1533]